MVIRKGAALSETGTAAQMSPLSMECKSSPEEYRVALGYLRAFVVVLVLAFHAFYAYSSLAPPRPADMKESFGWAGVPITDGRTWVGFDVFIQWMDTFFMSLMFFLSGLFVWKSLQRKGHKQFLRDRMTRLGLPFLVAGIVFPLLVFYPTYLLTCNDRSLAGYLQRLLIYGLVWPSGPAWFLWVLLLFDWLAARKFRQSPDWGDELGRRFASPSQRPVIFFTTLVAASAVVYVPAAILFTPEAWIGVGPFVFQVSRILLYLVYFLLGVGVGACGLGRGLIAPEGRFVRCWLGWLLLAALTACLYLFVLRHSVPVSGRSLVWQTAVAFCFVACCAASTLTACIIFVRFITRPSNVLDSLRDNAYGMYLIHFVYLSWVQYSLLNVPWHAWVKGFISLLCIAVLSWTSTALLRRVPAVARVI